MSQSQDKVDQFQGITGLSDDECRRHLQASSWNLDLALDRYFNSNTDAPAVFHQPTATPAAVDVLAPVALSPPPPPITPAVDDNDDDSLLCGLFPKRGGKESVPLRALSVKARVVDMVSEVEVTQRYFNDTDTSIEAVFKFKQEECAIFGFEAVIDGYKVVGEVKEKEEALNTYDDAISSGGHGFLLVQDEKVKGAFNMSVGNLPPRKECVITFRYVSELINEGHNVRVSFPITKLLLGSTQASSTTLSGEGKDGLQVEIDVEMPSTIPSIESLSGHEIDFTITHDKAHITFDSSKHISSRGLVLLIGQHKVGEPQAIVEIDSEAGSAVAMVSFIAELEQLRDCDVIAEVIFVVDRSGSMAGSRMNQAKNALALFLHSLPVGTRFNVIGFGSNFSKLFPASVVYDDATLATANNHSRELSANMGGTELMGPLRAVLSSPVDPMFPRQVFVLTDGEVSNTNEVIDYVRKNAKDTRVFTLGIGSDASTELVNGMAKAGQGQSEFVISGERMEAKVLRQLKRALQPVLKQPKVEFGRAGEGDSSSVVKCQAPKALPAVFDGERVISYAFFNTTDAELIESVLSETELIAKTDMEENEEVRLKVLVGDESGKARIKEGKIIHRLAARTLIREMEESVEGADAHKAAITELAVRYSLVSSYTSFVAVADGEQAVEGTMRQVQVNDALLDTTDKTGPVLGGLSPQNRIRCDDDQHDSLLADLAQLQEKAEEMGQALSAQSGSIEVRAAKSKKKGGWGGGGLFSSLKNAVSSMLPSGREEPAGNSYVHASRSGPNAPPFVEKEKSFMMAKASLRKTDKKVSYDGSTAVLGDAMISSLGARRRSHSSGSDDASDSDWEDEEEEEENEEKEEKQRRQRSASKLELMLDNDDMDFCAEKEMPAQASVSMDLLTSGLVWPEEAAAEPLPQTQIPIVPTPSAAPLQAAISLPTMPAPAPARASYQSSTFAKPAAPAPNPSLTPISSRDAAHMRPLDRFVHYQKANGSWMLDEHLAQAVGRSLSSLLSAKPEHVSAEVWATALALGALEANFFEQKEEWELLAGKARRWLAREWTKVNKAEPDRKLEDLLIEANSFLRQ